MTTRCPDCGSEIAADSPGGLCPKCLYQAGLPSQPPVQRGFAATIPSPGTRGFTAPRVEHLAALFPQLEILELLGQGGMGAVYKARHTGLDRLVALKVLPAEIGQDPAFVERFLREARALAKLNHPHIVAVYDVNQAGGLYYFLMEYVDGVNLRQTLRTGSISPQQALAIVPQMCDALQFAHDKGIVHRDIKPENILLDKQRGVKIADFGLAKLLGQDVPDHARTGTYQVMGTMRYMAPEQMLGTRDVDHRADIYSLGVVFYELLTGDIPMGRFAPPSKKKVEIDVRIDEVVLRALEQEPEQRFQHASEVKNEVEAISRDRLPQLRKEPAGPSTALPLKPIPGVTTRTSLAAQILPRNGKDLLPVLVLLPLVIVLFVAIPFFVVAFTLAATKLIDGPGDDDVRIFASAAAVANVVFFSAFIVFGLGSLRNLSVGELGMTLHRYVGRSRFVAWQDITHVQELSPWDVIFQVWLWPGLPPRGSILGMSAQRFFRIDCRDGCYYFCPRHVDKFIGALAPHTAVTIEAVEIPEKPGKTWEDSWRAVPPSLRQVVHIALALVYGFALICVFSFSSGKEGMDEAAKTWMKVGQPSPWLTMDSHSMGFNWRLNLLTWAVPIAIAAWALIALVRRLEIAEKGQAHSLWWHYVGWSVMVAVVLSIGMVQHYLGSPLRKKAKEKTVTLNANLTWRMPATLHAASSPALLSRSMEFVRPRPSSSLS